MRVLAFAAVAAALTLAGAAQAQTAPAPGTVNPATFDVSPGAAEMRTLDRASDFERLRDDVARRKAGPTKSRTPVPASPGDVTPGREVRDKKGLLVGTVERVDAEFAVVAGPLGKLEVELKSFAKNNKGLLINLPKAKLDAMMSGKPAN